MHDVKLVTFNQKNLLSASYVEQIFSNIWAMTSKSVQYRFYRNAPYKFRLLCHCHYIVFKQCYAQHGIDKVK